MKAELIIPIDTLRGALRKDGYYFRMYRGQQIVQRCPRKWVDTPARKAARERFIERYGKSKKTQNDPKNHARPGGNYTAENDNRHQMPD